MSTTTRPYPINKKAAPKGGQFLRGYISSAGGFPDRVLGVADRAVRCALGLVHLAFGLKLLIAGHFAGCVLDVSLSHVGFPSLSVQLHSTRPMTQGSNRDDISALAEPHAGHSHG